jgi:hypothetical protein
MTDLFYSTPYAWHIERALAATFVDQGIWDLIDVDAWMCSKVSW